MRVWLLCVALLPSVAAAEIYKWTDANGTVHFDQRQVSGSAPVAVKPQVIERDEATRQRQERTDNFYNARREEQAQAQQRASKQQAEVHNYCASLRNKLAQIPPGSTYYSVNDKGDREYYSDQQLDTARRQISQQIARDCD